MHAGVVLCVTSLHVRPGPANWRCRRAWQYQLGRSDGIACGTCSSTLC